jgi:hypothetical protein
MDVGEHRCLEEEEEKAEGKGGEKGELQRQLAVYEEVYNCFKVDGLALEEGSSFPIVLYNINLPVRLCQDESSLIRVRDIVAADFLNATNIYF